MRDGRDWLSWADVRADQGRVDASAYAFAHGVRRTRSTLRAWQHERWRIMRRWVAGSALAAFGLLLAVLAVSALSGAGAEPIPSEPPVASAQAYLLGERLAAFAHSLGVPPALLLLAVLPHAIPELVALFLPLAAWIMASRRGEWDQLLAAALVEVYVSPHLFHALAGTHIPAAPHWGE
jgi:hypothetical protein